MTASTCLRPMTRVSMSVMTIQTLSQPCTLQRAWVVSSAREPLRARDGTALVSPSSNHPTSPAEVGIISTAELI